MKHFDSHSGKRKTKKPGKASCLGQFGKAADVLFSAAVSAVRQLFESLFNRSNDNGGLQNAGKVRSTKGLVLHLFCGLTAAVLPVVWNLW